MLCFSTSKARFFGEFGYRVEIWEVVAGDIGTVVHVHQSGAGYEVEFMTLAGETLAVTTLLPSQLRPIASRDVAHVRELIPA